MYDTPPSTNSSRKPAPEQASGSVARKGTGMARILIVEDDTDLRDMLNESLLQAGYHTGAVADIRAARDALANLPYDLILL